MAKVSVLSFVPAKVNCAIVTGSERSLIIDCGPGPAAAEVLAHRCRELQAAQDNPFDVVITHDHWDHFFGAATLHAAGATTIYSSHAFAADQEASAWIALDALRNDPDTRDFATDLPTDPGQLVVETTPVSDGFELDLGDCRVEFHILGGHSTADVAVRLDDLGIVFAGDLIEEGGPPQAGSDASLSAWGQSLSTLLGFREATVFIPGHGVPVGRDFVATALADVEDLRTNSGAEVALPARTLPGAHDRSLPREYTIG